MINIVICIHFALLFALSLLNHMYLHSSQVFFVNLYLLIHFWGGVWVGGAHMYIGMGMCIHTHVEARGQP